MRVFGGSKTGRPEGRPERPPRRSATRSKSTRSSRLCSVSLSSVLFRLLLLRVVAVGKFFFPSRGWIRFFVASKGRIRKFQFALWTFTRTRVPSSFVAVVERQPSTLDRWHRIVDAFKNLRATAAAARMRVSHRPTQHTITNVLFFFEILIRPLDTKGVTRISTSCVLDIPKPTSGHPKVPPEFPCSFFFGSPNPTSRHQSRKGSSIHKSVVHETKTPTRTSSTSEACTIHWFFIWF